MRLLLRRVLERQVRSERPSQWWPACFDSGRRMFLDATLGSMSIRYLALAAEQQKLLGVGEEHLVGPAEALFVAVGKRLSRGAKFSNELLVVGRTVLERLSRDSADFAPWSRPCATWESYIECSAIWAWIFNMPRPQNVDAGWTMPGWSSELPVRYPEWLDPRATFHRNEVALPQGPALTYFISVSHRYVERSRPPSANSVAVLLKPAMVCAVAEGKWPMDLNWWSGLIGQDWAENSLIDLLAMLPSEALSAAAQRLWPSLVQWQRLNLPTSSTHSGRRSDLILPSCRVESQYSSPVMEWVKLPGVCRSDAPPNLPQNFL